MQRISIFFTGIAVVLSAGPSVFGLELISVDSDEQQGVNGSYSPSISADGRYVVFATDEQLDPVDTNIYSDIYLRDREAGTTILLTKGIASIPSDGSSFDPVIAADASAVVYWSEATNLSSLPMENDMNGVADVFVRSLVGGQTARISKDSLGNEGNDSSQTPSISADGSIVAFSSSADNLVAGDGNGRDDIFVVQVGIPSSIERISVTPASMDSDGNSFRPSVSPDGDYVSFGSAATNLVLGDTNGEFDIFLRNLMSDTTSLISLDQNGDPSNGGSLVSSVSRDGLFVAFGSSASDLVADDTNLNGDVFVRNVVASATIRVSVNSAEQQGDEDCGMVLGGISDDGSKVAFFTKANLGGVVSPGIQNLYVREVSRGVTKCLSEAPRRKASDGNNLQPVISADGTLVAFYSKATNLISNDVNGATNDVYVGTTNPIDPRLAILEKIRKFKKKQKAAKRRDQIAKVKRFKKKIRKFKILLRTL